LGIKYANQIDDKNIVEKLKRLKEDFLILEDKG
jgi:hypothetical protein